MDDVELATRLRDELQEQRTATPAPFGMLDAAHRRLRRRRRQRATVAAAVLAVAGAGGLITRATTDDSPVRLVTRPEPSVRITSTPQSTSEPSGPTTSSAPSQSPTDAVRDGVVDELALLPLAVRSRTLVSVPFGDKTWVLSRPTVALNELAGENCTIGDPGGTWGRDVICPTEYGEILLLNAAGRIDRAYPMPVVVPSWIHVTDDAVFAGRIGDGGVPFSSLVRIDRDTLEAAVIVSPPFEGVAVPLVFSYWRTATLDEATRGFSELVTYGPGSRGTRVATWIGVVGVDIPGVDELFGPS